MKSNKELLKESHIMFTEDLKEKNSRGKKLGYIKSMLKKGARKIRRKSINIEED